jgi:hypothetical protein
MPEFTRHNRGGIDKTSSLDAELRHTPELLIVKVINDVLEYALDIGCDEVRLESNDLELRITYAFTGMRIEETTLPGFYHDLLREALSELAAPDTGDAGPGEEWSVGALWNETSFRATVVNIGEIEIRVTFSLVASE